MVGAGEAARAANQVYTALPPVHGRGPARRFAASTLEGTTRQPKRVNQAVLKPPVGAAPTIIN